MTDKTPVKQKEVMIADGVPVSDIEAKALREQGITREIDLVRAEIENHEGKAKERD